MAQHVVVFAVDGVRLDVLRSVATPAIDAIEAAGFLHDFEVSADAPTVSGPCWATVATGVFPARHGVLANEIVGHRLAAYPDFLTRARDAGLATYIAVDWAPLVTTAHHGPIFGPPTRLFFIDGQQYGYPAADAGVIADAARALPGGQFAVAFVYLGNVDHVGHYVDTAEAYRMALETADQQIDQVIGAIRADPSYRDEEWTFIVVTDHGHRDGGGHGGRSVLERTAWIAAAGAAIPAGVKAADHTDVAPTVLAALGMKIHVENGFQGAPFGRSD
jgi:arylsulfatase A-like enzyme